MADPKSTLGLGSGIWAKIANFTAVGVVLWMFLTDRHDALNMAREDRDAYRSAIEQLVSNTDKRWRDLRHDSERQWQAIRDLTEAVRKLAEKKGE